MNRQLPEQNGRNIALKEPKLISFVFFNWSLLLSCYKVYHAMGLNAVVKANSISMVYYGSICLVVYLIHYFEGMFLWPHPQKHGL